MSAEPEPLVGLEELEQGRDILNEIISRHQQAGSAGVDDAFRECNIDPNAASVIAAQYFENVPYGDPRSFCAGLVHGMQLGVLAHTMVADSYIIDVITPGEEEQKGKP